MASHNAQKRIPLEGGAALLCAVNGVISLSWENEDGKLLKSAPSQLKLSDPKGIDGVKSLVKDIRAELMTWKDKIERYYLSDTSWSYVDWRTSYADHGTLSLLARRLVWTAKWGGKTIAFLPTRDGCINERGKKVEINNNAVINLWHPLHASLKVINLWREYLMQLGIMQPFRQVWREVYHLTDAERTTKTYSNRFAGHILKQHQMMALAIANGWQCQHRTHFDSPDDQPTYLSIRELGLQAEYWNSAFKEVDECTPGGSYIYVKTDRLKFHLYDEKARFKRGIETPISKVPPIVFSEVMRHCDLFTSVAAITLDPEWVDKGGSAKHPSFYDDPLYISWCRNQENILPPSAEMRREMLQTLLPKMEFSNQVSLSEKYVEVRGKQNTYLINIGSGAVHIEEHKWHICIVPDHTKPKGRVSLPFETDTTLSAIFSKIALLLNDDEINDPIILHQLK